MAYRNQDYRMAGTRSVSYFQDRDPREIIAALALVTLAAMCWVARMIAQAGVLGVLR